MRGPTWRKMTEAFLMKEFGQYSQVQPVHMNGVSKFKLLS